MLESAVLWEMICFPNIGIEQKKRRVIIIDTVILMKTTLAWSPPSSRRINVTNNPGSYVRLDA